MRRYDHIVFDIDGTLIDTRHAVIHGLQDAVRELTGCEMEIDQLLFSFGIPGEVALRILGVPNSKEALIIWNRHIRKYWDTIDVFPGIRATLDRLAESGIAIGIVTSKTRKEYEVEFCRFNISRLFAIAVTADDTALHKPEPDPLIKYMDIAGAQPGARFTWATAYTICAAPGLQAWTARLRCGERSTGMWNPYGARKTPPRFLI